MATAIAVLDSGEGHGATCRRRRSAAVVGRISFFLNAGIRFVEEICKGRAMTSFGTTSRPRALRHRPTPKQRRFRYGVQVNSLGLTEAAAREQRDPHRARGAGCHALEVRMRVRARSSCRRGTRRSACRGRGTSSGRCASSRSWPTRRTCSSTGRSSSTAPTSMEGQDARASRTKPWPSCRSVLDHGRRGRRRRERLHEAAAGRRAQSDAGARHRIEGELTGDRRELVHRDRALAADRGRRPVDPGGGRESAEREQIESPRGVPEASRNAGRRRRRRCTNLRRRRSKQRPAT